MDVFHTFVASLLSTRVKSSQMPSLYLSILLKGSCDLCLNLLRLFYLSIDYQYSLWYRLYLLFDQLVICDLVGSSLIVPVIALYITFKHVIGRYSNAPGLSFFGISIVLPSTNHDGNG